MEIGGYFELELPLIKEYHTKAIRLNTGRNAFEYILKAKKYQKVYLPYYTCDVMLEPIRKLGLELEYYKIDKTFRQFNFDLSKIKEDEVFVYNNYYGICEKQVEEISQICKNLIIDNSQAFYSNPISGVDTLYSPRKFFGVPDGAYLYTDTHLNIELQKDVSFNRCEHLIGRIDTGAEKHYREFKKNSSELCNQSIKSMSNFTQKILSGIDYDIAAKKRRDNFSLLNESLKKRNRLQIQLLGNEVPLVYPFLVENGGLLRQKLIESKVFVAVYWPNVLGDVRSNSWESNLVENLVNLPIDQRYTSNEMNAILNILK